MASVVESADEAAADCAVEAAWVACPLSLVVAGAAVNGVSWLAVVAAPA